MWECQREVAQLKQMKIKPGDSRGRIKTNHTQKFCKENEHCILPKAFTHDVSSME